MAIIVTGGCGFIGQHIVRALEGKDVGRIFVVDDFSGCRRTTDQFDNTFSEVWNMDCAAEREAGMITKTAFGHGGKVRTLVHLAANAREGASQFQPTSVCRRNVMAYANMLTQAIKHGVKHVVLFSSMAVYGEQTPPFDETLTKMPADIYGMNKAMMEDMTAVLSKVHGFTYTIIRPHNVFGEGQVLYDRLRNVVAIFMNKIMRGEQIEIYGDGNQTRAFSYIEDSLPCFMRVIEAAGKYHEEVFNIGGVAPITVNQLARVVCEDMLADGHTITHFPDRPCEVKHAFSSYAKSVDQLGYKEGIGWREGIHKMAAWARAQGPQEWGTGDPLEIVNDKTPIPWQ